MKATDLRIGNLVYGINRRGEVHLPVDIPLKVLQIGLFNSECLPYDQNPAQVEEWFKITNSDLTGIPLTPEWLERAGFEKGYDDVNEIIFYEMPAWGRVKLDFNTLKPAEHYFLDGLSAEIQYVHQLQNLYHALTGNELAVSETANLN